MSDRTPLIYDETGSFAALQAMASALNGASAALNNGTEADSPASFLPVGDLNGSWYLQITPDGPHEWAEIRGPLRIEVSPPRLRVSADIYVNRTPPPVGTPLEILSPIPPSPLTIEGNWYPQFPFEQYAWYLRSTSAVYASGVLTINFDCRFWDAFVLAKPHEREFLPPGDRLQTGVLILDCPASAAGFTHPRLPNAPTARVSGRMQIGETLYQVVATKSSPYYRGCAVVVDTMENRSFPLDAKTCQGVTLDYTRIYRESAGFDIALTLRDTPLPESPDLTTVELEAALDSRRQPAVGAENQWLIWMLIGSRQGGLFGIMFDDSPPFREGVAGFYDSRFFNDVRMTPASQGKKLGEIPEAFLRTLVHETGHAFNLFHPKHDVHPVPLGVTLMNQTGDVMGFAGPQNLFPCCIAFSFDDHNRGSLIHSPDPQIAPGWKRFGWGHGSLSSGVSEPMDALGQTRRVSLADDLTLLLEIPATVFRGEFVAAKFTLTNIGSRPHEVSTALNLSQGDLRLLVTPPGKVGVFDARDVTVGCGDRETVRLKKGESITGTGQIFYTNFGHTFRQLGRYYVSAEMHVGDTAGTLVRSHPVAVVVRAPINEDEQKIALLTIDGDKGVQIGRAFAMGDFGTDEETRQYLQTLASDFGQTDTGRAAAFVLSNSLARPVRDLRTPDGELRPAEPTAALDYFTTAADTLRHDPSRIATLAVAVAAPTEAMAPVLNQASDYLNAPPVPNNDTSAAAALPLTAAADDLLADPSAAAAAVGAFTIDAPASDFADAAQLLSQMRQTFPASRSA